MSYKCALLIPSDTRYLSFLREWLEAFFNIPGERTFTKKTKIACTLSLIEAVDNAIFHAHSKQKKLPIGIKVALTKTNITIEISDCGKGIGRYGTKLPEGFANHGRGLILIRELMSKVESLKRENRHTLRMTYKL